jgi:hypothetical protein
MMFCPYCGSKIQPVISEAGGAGQERVEGAIPLAADIGVGGDERLSTLVVTTTRLLIARITEADQDKMRKASGSLLMGGAAMDPERHRRTLGAYSVRYLTMEPGSILAESAENESLYLTEVRSIHISSVTDAQGDQSYLLSLETNRGPRSYRIASDKDSRDLLISVFGPKLHW